MIDQPDCDRYYAEPETRRVSTVQDDEPQRCTQCNEHTDGECHDGEFCDESCLAVWRGEAESIVIRGRRCAWCEGPVCDWFLHWHTFCSDQCAYEGRRQNPLFADTPWINKAKRDALQRACDNVDSPDVLAVVAERILADRRKTNA